MYAWLRATSSGVKWAAISGGSGSGGPAAHAGGMDAADRAANNMAPMQERANHPGIQRDAIRIISDSWM
jgi:hypothetical protein